MLKKYLKQVLVRKFKHKNYMLMKRNFIFFWIISSLLVAQKYEDVIQPIWDEHCASCHTGNNYSGDLDLSSGSSYDNMVNVNSKGYQGYKLVKPGDSMNSVLFQKIVENIAFGNPMPPGGNKLSLNKEEKIKKWINDGALKEWGDLAIENEFGITPNLFGLAQNYPNPFNAVTSIQISLVKDSKITIKVYDFLGKEVNSLIINQSLQKGSHRFIWKGEDDNGYQLPSGVYLYRLEVNSMNGRELYQNTKKMIMLK